MAKPDCGYIFGDPTPTSDQPSSSATTSDVCDAGPSTDHSDQPAVTERPKRGKSNADRALLDMYNELFDCREIDDPEGLDQVFRLRYQVYCEETGFLDPADNPNGRETDLFDDRSRHAGLFYKPTGRLIGTVRVVLPDASAPGAGLPAVLHAPALKALPASRLPHHRTGEISRFAVCSSFRRRRGDGLYGRETILVNGRAVDPRRVVPHATLGLIKMIFQIAIDAGLSHTCAIIDPALLRMMRRLGFLYEPVGPTVEFHGPRQPVCGDGVEMMRHLADERPEIFDVVSDGGKLSISDLMARRAANVDQDPTALVK
ncbi:MAG: PEP-CTERM/exosortase system-associated acyltransferase [Pseudomonadota bacterium]